ncbi:hypothetical protein [Arthrobacter sp. H5]|uniref:hypothetical protein n=1 Tax=Arthrobacter sp. H5 TaxID=1267973 RepID=UPI0004860432|nr:hypothetical protein [Arthrobacter sp. H5]
MSFLLNLAAAVTPEPGDEPSLRPGLDPSQVTPGTLGFLATLFLVVAVIFLIRDMVKRIRRVRYRALAEEEAQQLRERSEEVPSEEPGAPEVDTRPVPGGKHGPDAP